MRQEGYTQSGSSGFRSNNLPGDLVDLLDLEPVLGMFRLDMPHQQFHNRFSRFPLRHVTAVHP
jgi:hypothetical protein